MVVYLRHYSFIIQYLTSYKHVRQSDTNDQLTYYFYLNKQYELKWLTCTFVLDTQCCFNCFRDQYHCTSYLNANVKKLINLINWKFKQRILVFCTGNINTSNWRFLKCKKQCNPTKNNIVFLCQYRKSSRV